tara:strand:+ start:303 stop:779 length:477 start_codon:yes stop_codon:yes gene_type:complete
MSTEEIAAYSRRYNQSPVGKKRMRISRWKRDGIVSNDWDATYERFMNTLNCENTECNVLLTTDRKMTETTKCLDHDHNKKDEPNVRAVLCNNCNVNDNSRNTSGVPNVSKEGNSWRYRRVFNRVTHRSPRYKTFEEACDYKTAHELSLRIPNQNGNAC